MIDSRFLVLGHRDWPFFSWESGFWGGLINFEDLVLGSRFRIFPTLKFTGRLNWHQQYLPRLSILFYILSHLGSICRGLAFYSFSYHALAVSAEAWHSILYLITPWQYLRRLYLITPWQYLQRLYLITPWQYLPKLGMLFYILTWAMKAQV